ncbi:thioredoxin-like 1-2, chloroplastic isoform X2 [Ananas comosus]|uniref:Thioredoxin-like 1-2, chloroplastic isoform X2 n=1 Tax=Ananas comosus TaxID=4615 RepID=A0A6P5G8R4_ANACO|nr:thioredoxin-like 1-2, chloroplastic isoform X2 [Ananas comosus]
MAAASMKGVSFTGSYEVGVEVKEKKFKSSEGLACKNELKGRKVLLREQSGSFASWNPKTQSCSSITAQSSIYIPRTNRWWEKSMKPNMIEITSVQDLVDSLRSAGDKLVVVGFYSPSCGGCKTLHPKIYKFKKALENHGTERCSLGPAKGLEESELRSLASNKEIQYNYPLRPHEDEDLALSNSSFSDSLVRGI